MEDLSPEERQIQQGFSDQLDHLINHEMINFDPMKWFCEDYSGYSKVIIDEICRRIIERPRLAMYQNIDQPLIHIFYFLDFLFNSLEPPIKYSYLYAISPQLYTIFHESIGVMDMTLFSKVEAIVYGWKDSNFFEPDIIQPVIELFSQYKTIPTTDENETTFLPPPSEWKPIDQNVDVFENNTGLRERKWMRSAIEWETPIPLEDLSSPVGGELKQTGGYLFYINAENENAKCAICNGSLDIERTDDGRRAYKNVIYIEGKGYVHQKCHEDSLNARQNKIHQLIQFSKQ